LAVQRSSCGQAAAAGVLCDGACRAAPLQPLQPLNERYPCPLPCFAGILIGMGVMAASLLLFTL